MARTILYGAILASFALPAAADCFSQFAKKNCSNSQPYTCKQKANELSACQAKERETQRALAARAEAKRAGKEKTERAAIQAIERANRTVHKQPGSRPRQGSGNSSASPEKMTGTSF